MQTTCTTNYRLFQTKLNIMRQMRPFMASSQEMDWGYSTAPGDCTGHFILSLA